MCKILAIYTFLFISIVLCSCGVLEVDEFQKGQFITLPESSDLGDTTKFDIFYVMSGSYGSSIEFIRQFTGGPFGQYYINTKLLIDSGTIAMTDTMTCLLSIDAGKTSVLISPIEQYFAHPFKLTLTYVNIDLQGLDLSELAFVYSNGNDVTLDVVYDNINVNIETGTLEVVNAIIKYDPAHVPDGRYGWIRKAD